ncbi:MAG: TRAP transporter small permease [Sandaracinaceae bacterium]
MSETAEEQSRTGPFKWVRKLDDVVFAIEQSIVALSLITITVVVFVDVIARRITAPDSKVGALVSKLAGIEDEPTRAWVDTTLAPIVSLVVGLAVLSCGSFAARRFSRARENISEDTVQRGREVGTSLLMGVAGCAGVAAFMWVFGQLESRTVYVAFFGLSAAGFVAYVVKQKSAGWQVQAGVAAVLGGLMAFLSWDWIPEGYTWSKQISLQLLLWVGMFSASICVYAGKHIRVEATAKLVPVKARRYVTASGMLLAASFCSLMAYLGFRYVVAPEASDDEYMTELLHWGGVRYVYGFEGLVGQGGMIEGTSTDRHIDGIPNWIGILSAPIGFGIAALRFLGAAVSAVLGGSYGAAAIEEGLEEARAAKAELAEAMGNANADAETEDDVSDDSKHTDEADGDSAESDADSDDADADSDDADAGSDDADADSDEADDPPPRRKKKRRKKKRGKGGSK